ncbi:MAG: NAD-dependent epimerase/dehydratase family protein, partial [Betaproteobacteria bacterium]|nr:NAD-dependent epimerase/dehydratase family protein [Betaproteobacteria bacterium]
MKDKIVLAGGTGFLGKALAQCFAEKEYEIVVLGRSNELPVDFPKARLVTWDARTSGTWVKELEGAKALVNLCGRSVDCRYNETNRRLILESRVNATRVLGDAVAQAKSPPKVWLNAGTATIYEDRRGELPPHDENSDDLGAGFSVEVAKAWEEAFFETQVHNVRKVAMRISIVLGESGGAFP